METLLMIVPVVVIALSIYFAIRKLRATHSPKKAFAFHLATVAILALFVVLCAVPVLAADNDTATPQVTAAEVGGEEAAAPVSDSAKGLGLIGAALVTGLAGIGGGIAIAAAAPAAIGATSEDPKVFGKALIFVALGEAIALYGVIISILIMQKV